VANRRLGGSGPLQKEKKLHFTSKPRTKKQKRLFDEITETLQQARVLLAKMAKTNKTSTVPADKLEN
jgi:hypothetical protein